MVFGGGDFGKRVGHEGEDFIHEIHTHIKETPESSFYYVSLQ